MLPLVVLLLSTYTTALGCSLNNQDEVGFYSAGDIMIGGLIPVHMTWQDNLNDFTSFQKPITCSNFSVTMYSWVQAIAFAINEINKDQSLLPNINLGFLIYDTCLSARKAIEETLWMLTGQDKAIPNYQCKRSSPLTAVIGESSSTVSISIARLLGLLRYPQVSYFSTSSLLSDKDQYPSFFRTIPSDDIQARGLAQLLLHYMKRVNFKNKVGETVSFDTRGNQPALYDIINWQRGSDGAIQYIKVGLFNTMAPNGKELYVNGSALLWTKQGKEVPQSVCSESCSPGSRKAAQTGHSSCCFDCIMCPEGEMSKEPDSSNCWPCPSDQWPNKWRSGCVPKIIEFLSYDEPLGASLTATVILYVLMTVIVLCFFVKYRETPIIKANNRTLSYLILVALMMSFLCSFLFIGEPLTITCIFRQPAFGIIFVFCVSCVLAKTIIVVIAFNATNPNSDIRRWLSLWVPLITVSVCTVIQVIICATWLMLCPPFPVKDMTLKTGTIIFHCNECSQTAFWCMMGYMGFLAGVSFTVASFARKLPDSFNEAKWITISMIIFISVWVSFFPGYLSTQGKYMVAVEVFGIISSSAGLLTCIFVPKLYIMFLKPELNTRGYLLEGSSSRKRKPTF
ncbi:extracellular calcium-sensing receptor-like [Lissotriton helveticus]